MRWFRYQKIPHCHRYKVYVTNWKNNCVCFYGRVKTTFSGNAKQTQFTFVISDRHFYLTYDFFVNGIIRKFCMPVFRSLKWFSCVLAILLMNNGTHLVDNGSIFKGTSLVEAIQIITYILKTNLQSKEQCAVFAYRSWPHVAWRQNIWNVFSKPWTTRTTRRWRYVLDAFHLTML